MNTLNENSKSSSKLITINKRPYNRIADFIAEYDGKKYIKIYTPKKYPLLLAKENEEFVIIANEYDNYILRVVDNAIKAIYSSDAKKLLEATDKQSIVLLPQESNKFLLQSFKKKANSIIERLDNTLIVAIYELGKKAKLFNISKNEYILESSYINTLLFQDDNYIFEKCFNKIKAICNINGDLALKSDENFLKIIDKIYVEEIYSDGKCHSIYVKPRYSLKYEKIITDCTFDLSILNISWYFDPKDVLILGKVKEKCKALFLYNFERQTLISSPILNKADEYNRYFEVFQDSKKDIFFIKIMVNKNCIGILNSKFTSIVSLNENEDDISNTSFEITSFSDKKFIKKMFNYKCIAIYDINGNLCSISKNKDTNIVLFKGYETILFMHKLHNEYVKIEGKHLPTLSSLVYEPVIKDKVVVAIYGIKNGKRVAIYNFRLNKIVSYEDIANESLEIVFSFICEENDPSEYDIFIYQNIIFLKYDLDGKCRKIYNEKNVPILESKDNNYFKIYGKFILEYRNEKCIAFFAYVNENLQNVLKISSNNYELIPFITSNNQIFVEEYNYTTKNKINLYQESYKYFYKILSDYNDITEWHNYLIISDANSNALHLVKISYVSYESSKIFTISPTHGGTLKIASDSQKQVYAYELDDNKKIISIYYLNNEKFINTITSEDGIEIVKIDNFDFFKVKDKIYNLLGYEV